MGTIGSAVPCCVSRADIPVTPRPGHECPAEPRVSRDGSGRTPRKMTPQGTPRAGSSWSSYCCTTRSPNPFPGGLHLPTQDLQKDHLGGSTIPEEEFLNLDEIFDSRTSDELADFNSTCEVSTLGCGVLVDTTNMHQLQNERAHDSKHPSIKHPSIGSEKHFEGTCKRCCFFPRKRCTNGEQCEFCHYDHEKRTHKKRKANVKSRFGEGDGSEDKENEFVNNMEPSVKGRACPSASHQFDTQSKKERALRIVEDTCSIRQAMSSTNSPTSLYAERQPQQLISQHLHQESSPGIHGHSWQASSPNPIAQPDHCVMNASAAGIHQSDQWMANLDANQAPTLGHNITSWTADGGNMPWNADGQWQRHGAQMSQLTWDQSTQISNDQPSWWSQAQHSQQQVGYGWQPSCQQVTEPVVFESASWQPYTDGQMPEGQQGPRPLPPGVTVAHDAQPPPMDPTWRAWPHIAKFAQNGMQSAADIQPSSTASVPANA